MNDEATRKFIQAMKRLMTFCQRRYPTDPSRCVDFDGFSNAGRGAVGGGGDKAVRAGGLLCLSPCQTPALRRSAASTAPPQHPHPAPTRRSFAPRRRCYKRCRRARRWRPLQHPPRWIRPPGQ